VESLEVEDKEEMQLEDSLVYWEDFDFVPPSVVNNHRSCCGSLDISIGDGRSFEASKKDSLLCCIIFKKSCFEINPEEDFHQ
jgi:hypothetical protein